MHTQSLRNTSNLIQILCQIRNMVIYFIEEHLVLFLRVLLKRSVNMRKRIK